MREPLRAELGPPFTLDLGDGVTNHVDRVLAAAREGDAPRTQVVGVWQALEVAEPFELSEKVVERLLADPEPRAQLGRPRTVWAG